MECENSLLQRVFSPAQEVDTWEVSTLIVFHRRERGEVEREIQRITAQTPPGTPAAIAREEHNHHGRAAG